MLGLKVFKRGATFSDTSWKPRKRNIINKIASHEDSVSAAVDVAREVHRRDLVTEETGETIQRETKALEDRLEGLIGDAEKRKQRIAEALRNAEQTTTVNETMVASSVIAVHSSPDESHDDSQSDEGFVEPKHHFFKKKPTYESLINQKIKDFRKETKAMHDWMDESETLVKSFSVDMDSQKATKVQQKVNTHYEEIKEKQAKLDHIVLLSKQIENETLDPTVSEPFVKQADHLKERWKKVKEMIENYGEADAGSKAKEGNCCVIFLKKRLFPAWYYN